MKEYNLMGHEIGIVVSAKSKEEAIEIAENMLLQGWGGWVDCLDDDEDDEE